MIRFVVKRVLLVLIGILLANFIGFAFVYPGNITQTAGSEVPPPITEAYIDHIQKVLHLDLGTFPGDDETVLSRIASAAIASFGLMALATTMSVIVGLILGIIAARMDPPKVAWWMTPISTVGLAMPSFYLGSLLIVAAIYYAILGGPQARQPLPLQGFGWDLHLVLPVFVLMIRPALQIAQMTSNLLVEEFGKQYVMAARSLGYSRDATRRITIRNIPVGVILVITASLRLMIGQLIVVEWLFAWPGLGRLLVLGLIPQRTFFNQANLLYRNPNVVAVILSILAAVFLFGDLFAAIWMRVLDPRMRTAKLGRK